MIVKWLTRIAAIALIVAGLGVVLMRDVKVRVDYPPGSGRAPEQVAPDRALPVVHMVGGVLVLGGFAPGLASLRRRWRVVKGPSASLPER